ncbi:MAG: DUF4337 domain-containing protein [Planctomycetota bacterium]|nr:DUF4337 domain-containing protein [Planctomycetota bacterium]
MALPKIPADGDKPKTLKDSIYTSTPVVLTVVATILAGMSSSEMTRAQYYRAMAAQNQAKAADQWGYYQSKRTRATEAQNALDLLDFTAHPMRLDLVGVQAECREASKNLQTSGISKEISDRAGALGVQLANLLSSPAVTSASGSIEQNLPQMTDKPISDPKIIQAMDAVIQGQTEEQMTPLLRQIDAKSLDDAILTADQNLQAFSKAVKPANAMLDKLHDIVIPMSSIAHRAGANGASTMTSAPTQAGADSFRQIDAAAADVTAARLEYSAARYEKEAQYNGVCGQLYEVEVRKSGAMSDRARNRSAELFYGMLAAQAGVVISTLSLAVRQRSVFWTLAALSGGIAVAFSGYIYLFT